MGFAVCGFDVGGADVGVDLGGDQTLVAEEFLDAANVRPSVEEMGCETMPEGMRGGTRVEFALQDVFFQHSGDAAGRQTIAEFISKSR